MATKIKQQLLNLTAQYLALKKTFPGSQCRIYRSELTWLGVLQPTPLSKRYTIKLTYKLNKSPKVKLVKPVLRKKHNKKPPHLYKGDFLCLYVPGIGEWNKNMYLSETIIPWASEWLFHYEIWLSTGDWCGGGIHPK